MADKKEKPAQTAGEASVEQIIAEAATKGSLSDGKLDAVLALMMAKEARLIEKERLLDEQIAARDAERKKESERYTLAIIENQMNCKHLKGGGNRRKSQAKDPSVYGHTFTDGKMHIKCTICKAKWMPGDTAEFYLRNGKKVPNWTGIGWKEASEMAADSSNRPSSSERFFASPQEAAVKESALQVLNNENLQL
jgi:hypothetical protein